MPDDYERLVKRIKEYLPESDLEIVDKAYQTAKRAHEGQLRVSGEPYIIHPVQVALILADLELDRTSIVAGLLHDTVEDTGLTLDYVREQFGSQVALLVDGVTKLGKIPYTTKEEIQAENFRKMFMAMAKDIRVILIKLADRLHNMRTLNYKDPEKQLEKARETLEIYAPIAHRLGISKIKWELEDICLRYLDPKGYYDLVEKIAQKRREREAYIDTIIESIRKKLEELGIEADIKGRPKHFYSIYKKMKTQNKTIDQIFDLFAVRVIVNSVKDCYAVLGAVHELFKPLPGRFKDYIAMPKPNMYQSIHNTLIGYNGQPFEIQIRTWDMHRVAEVGIAAHWKYKENINVRDDELDKKLAWLRELLDWSKETKDPNEYMENLKIDLFTDEVFVFTPKGDVKCLPVGSTAIDFAYSIHSEVGNRMIGAKINGKIEPITTELQTGDIVEIITSPTVHGPRWDWLKYVKSSSTRNKINQWFKKEKREENIAKGREIVEKELKKMNLSFSQLFRPEWLDPILRKNNYHNLDDLLAAIGYGGISLNKVLPRLKEEFKKTLRPEEIQQIFGEESVKPTRTTDKAAEANRKKPAAPENGVIVKGIDNCLVRLSKCCNPVPGDEIIGYITRGRGVSVHRKDCVNIESLGNDSDRFIEVKWYTGGADNVTYQADIDILANDRNSLLMDIANNIGEAGIPLKGINARTTKDRIAVIHLNLEISNTEQLDKIIKKLRKLDSVFEVTRSKNNSSSHIQI